MKKERKADAKVTKGLWLSLLTVIIVSIGSFGAAYAANWSPKLGLDLAGGLSVIYQPARPITGAEMAQEIAILTNRVNASGVSGASVQQQGTNIAVTVPGAKNAQEILATLGSTAQLYIRPVQCYANLASTTQVYPVSVPVPSCRPQYQISTTNYSPNSATVDPQYDHFASTKAENDVRTATVIFPGASVGTRYVLGPALLTGRVVKSAVAELDQTGQWVVSCNLTAVGDKAWTAVAGKYYHLPVAIELDGVVQSAPVINSTFPTGGPVQISGSFTAASAKQLATVLTYGSLPVSLIELQAQTVSPTLGHSSLIAGLGAGIAGLLVVLLFVVFYYRALGLVIVTGLGLTALLLWAIISALGHTSLAPSFTLAGVTGLIVSIGITVDSYIVYFERLKDETRSGRTVRTSVDRGFKSAWRTVLAADLVSLLAAVILYELALGDVRGFAFFLGLSTILDIVVTYYFTRPLVFLLGRNERATNSARFGVAKGLAVEAEVAQ